MFYFDFDDFDFILYVFIMIIDSHKDLPKIRNKHRREKIVFCSGSFDLPHAGHVLFFEDCRKRGDVLIVGVGGDEIISKNKGPNRPILNEHIRLKTIDSFKPVNYCFLDYVSTKTSPLAILNLVFEKMRPDAYVINEDAFDIPYRKTLANKYGIKLVIIKRRCPAKFNKISTSNIINKIKNA